MVLRIDATEKEIQLALSVFEEFLRGRVEKHGHGKFVGPHEALGVLTEEFWETVEATRSNNRMRIREEMLDCAVAAVWAYISLSEESADLD